MIEVVFVILVLCPWWVIQAWPSKGRWWWIVFLWDCVAFLTYYSVVHWAPGGIICTSVETVLGVYGLISFDRRKREAERWY